MKILLILIFLFQIQTEIFSQGLTPDLRDITEKTETEYGPDDILISGKLYFPKHKLPEEHPFFLKNEFIDATIYINGNEYLNIPLKYDMEQQKMLIKVFKNNTMELIEIIPDRIDSILILDYKFITSKMTVPFLNNHKYLELYWENGFRYIISRNLIYDPFKNRKKVISGGYKKLSINRYIISDNKLYTVNSKRSFLKLTKKKKNEVKTYMKKNNIKYKKLTEGGNKNLMQFCHEKEVF